MFTAFRILLLIVAGSAWGMQDRSWTDVLHAFLIGWRFDTAIACYLLAVPFLLLAITHAVAISARWPGRASHVFLCVAMVPCLLILSADIPWFLQFFSRFSTAALQWTNDGGYMYRMILQERSFWAYLLVFASAAFLSHRMLRWAFRKLDHERTIPQVHEGFMALFYRKLLPIVLGAMIFLGMRGRLDEKSPIQAGLAYFSEDPFLNQLGLNPVFTFGASLEKRFTAHRTQVQLMDERAAVWNAMRELGGEQDLLPSPIARRVSTTGPIDSLNVVIILMESMSTFKMGQYGGPAGLAPFLTALEKVSLTCDRAYSAGIHTYNGIYSTLYSFPALYDQQPMEDWLDRKHAGLANELRTRGWGTLFSTTHDAQFDNMEGFLRAHGFDQVISEDDYPQDWVASTNGVPDHRMFEFAVPHLNTLAKKGPFLAAFMTTSDHKPYILPDSLWFEPHSEKLEDRIVEYADRSVARFFELASKEPWYRKTVFVILGDHGVNMGHTYDLPLSFHHTPLLFHVPGGQVSPGRITAPCGQIDVAPTLMGMLNIPWTNTTMGLDILQRQRPFMYFCADDRIGCIDAEHYFIQRANGKATLFAYSGLSTEDLSSSLPEKTEAMRNYAWSMMQGTQWLVDHDLLDGGASRTNAALP